MTAKPYRVLLLSDLHAVHDAGTLQVEASMNYAQKSGPRGLLTLCLGALRERFADGVDLVLVAGDMTDKAAGGPLQEVWADLQWLAGELHAPLVATSGNHDYDSRASQGLMPKKSLMDLEPPFPFGAEADRDKYFSQEHAVYADESVVVVTANSSAHHGYVPDGEPEYEHGRFGDYLPAYLRKSLEKTQRSGRVGIFLTHHHMNQLPEFDFDERSFSSGHDDVIRTLSDFGDWLIVHGHKHRGWIQYASGSGDSPVLISSSSFSADLGDGPFAEKVRHQFHVIEVDLCDEVLEEVPGHRGQVYSWTHSVIGWAVASKKDDLPGVSGFGWKVNVRRLADRFRGELTSREVLSGVEILDFEPRFRFMTFDDLRRLMRYLEEGSPAVHCEMSPTGEIEEMSLVKKVS